MPHPVGGTMGYTCMTDRKKLLLHAAVCGPHTGMHPRARINMVTNGPIQKELPIALHAQDIQNEAHTHEDITVM